MSRKIMRGFAGILLLLVLTAAPRTFAEQRSSLRFVLVNIHSYQETRSIKSNLRQMDGVEGIKLLSEAPGLTVFEVQFLADPKDFFDKALSVFGDTYTLKEKKLPRGVFEINLAKR